MEQQRAQLKKLEEALAEDRRAEPPLVSDVKPPEGADSAHYFDPLTGLPNRKYFQQQLADFIALARREHRPLSVMLLNFNRFREINNTLGHDAGDDLLKEVSQRVCRTLRESDIAARFGADEFAVMLPTTHSLAGAQVVAGKVIEAVERPFYVRGHRLLMGVSVGIAMYPDHGPDDHAVMQQADRAMGLAKRAGGGCVTPDVDAEGSKSSGRLVLAGDLREAIERKELVMHYQPKVALATGEVIGGEALVRWQHPTDGLIFPDKFIPVIENTRVIDHLTHEVLDMALAWASGWRTEGRACNVSVNLSARTLHDGGLPNRIGALLEAHALPPEALVLEITEGAIMIDAERAMQVVTTLAELGVGIAIDDFGTGYSSLAYLRRLPATEIKIDRSFVMAMESNPEDVAIVRSVVDLGSSLGKQVVAEGIETAEAMQMLADMGCHAGQGYFISRPVPADGFRAWLEARQA